MLMCSPNLFFLESKTMVLTLLELKLLKNKYDGMEQQE